MEDPATGNIFLKPSRKTSGKLDTDARSLDGLSEITPFRAYNFNAFKYTKQVAKDSTEGSKIEFIQGDEVYHGRFGHGIVVNVEEKTVTVAFEELGIKKLAKGIAPLKKVGEKK